MSSVYVNEPVTNGHVIITTTHGPIDIHLWCNECPTTTKYFLQLCLDEYYNDMIFHRILPNLLIQTGLLRYNNDTSHNINDTTTTTTTIMQQQQQQQQHDLMKEYHKVINSQESYNRRFYELHSRIKFSHRGQVAMALPVNDNDNTNSTSRSKSNVDNIQMDDDYDDSNNIQEIQPQFFITTDEAPYLNGKHVLFGTIVGPTIFNAIRINQYTTSSTSSSNDINNDTTNNDDSAIIDYDSAPRIVSIKIIHNPFEETMIRSIRIIPWKVINHNQNDSTTQVHNNIKKKKRKGKFDINVLSFGDEIDTTTTITKTKIMKIDHDKNTKRIVDSTAAIIDQTNNQSSNDNNNINSFQSISQSETLQQIFDNNNTSNDKKVEHEISNSNTNSDTVTSSQQEVDTCQNNNNDNVNHTTHIQDTAAGGGSLVEARRAKYLSRQRLSSSKSGNTNNNDNNKTHNKQQRDDETYNKLIQFRRKIHDTILQANDKNTNSADVMNSNYDNSLASRMARRVQQQQQQQEEEEGEQLGHINSNNNSNESDPKVWIQTKFQCTKHIDLLSGDNKDAMEEYEVIEDQHYDGKIRNKKRSKQK